MEADEIIAKAREQADGMITDEEIVRQAQARADEIVRDAQDVHEVAREEMDAYALNMLQDLERRLATHLTSIERGIQAIETVPGDDSAQAFDQDTLK